MAFAILRFEKIKALPDLTAMAGHWDRTRPTPNADPKAQDWAVQFLHGQDGVFEVEKRLPAKRRKDAVICLEALLSASPEYFRPDDPSKAGVYDHDRTRAWAQASMKWLKKEFGNRLASAVVHLDEATPHIHAAIVPLDKGTGRLNAKEQFGRTELRRFQTDYAKAVKHLGIQRGQEYSQAQHEDVQRYYGIVNAAQEPPELTLGDKAALAIGKTPDTIKVLQAQAADGRKAHKELEKAKAEARRQAEARTKAETAAADAKVAERAMASRLREIPLTTVLPHLGYLRTQIDQDVEWLGPAGPLRTGAGAGKPGKYYLEELGKGGRGAIDLVMQVSGIDYTSAVAWLGRFFKEEALAADAAAQAEATVRDAIEEARARPPEPVLKLSQDPKDLALVRDRLINTGLAEGLIDTFQELGLIGAARFGHRPHIAFPLFQNVSIDPNEPPVGYVVEDLTRMNARPRRFGTCGIWRCSKIWQTEGSDREVHVLTRTPTEAIALHQVIEQEQGIVPPLEDQTIRRIRFFAVDKAATGQVAPLVEQARTKRAPLMFSLQDDEQGRKLTHVFAEEAKKQGVATSSLSGILQLAGVQSFLQLWLQILQQGIERIKEQIAVARARRQKAAAAQQGRGQGQGRD